MRKRYSRSYTVLSFLTMFSYREQPLRLFFFMSFASRPGPEDGRIQQRQHLRSPILLHQGQHGTERIHISRYISIAVCSRAEPY